jgi:hypothetical protein
MVQLAVLSEGRDGPANKAEYAAAALIKKVGLSFSKNFFHIGSCTTVEPTAAN